MAVFVDVNNMSKASVTDQAVKNFLPAWRHRENEWLTYKQLVEWAEKKGISERSVIRYLSALTQTKIIEKSETSYKRTLYKPYPKMWEALVTMRVKLVNEQEEYFCDDLKDIVSKQFEKTMTWYGEEGKSKNFNVPLTKNSLKQLKILMANLSNSLKITLTDHYIDRGIDPHAIYDILANNLTQLTSDQMALWSFIAITPGAAEEFSRQIDKCLKSH
jgi:hypothetical protein